MLYNVKRQRGEGAKGKGADSYKLSGFVLSASHAFSSSKLSIPRAKPFLHILQMKKIRGSRSSSY